MGEMKGFHVPKHIQKLRDEQAKARDEELMKQEPKIEVKVKKKTKKKVEKKVEKLTDEDAGAFGYEPEDHEVREE